MKDFNKAIKSGNSKLHKSCGIFNITCIYNCSYCYMKKMKKIHPNIGDSWEHNKALSKRVDFVEEVTKVIKRRKYKYFRVHAMGEFYDQTYLRNWYKIAKNCPDTQFYAYSKNYALVELCKAAKPANFTMVYSVKEIASSYKELKDAALSLPPKGFDSKAVICDNNAAMSWYKQLTCKAQDNEKGYCMGTCTRCAKKGKVTILPKH